MRPSACSARQLNQRPLQNAAQQALQLLQALHLQATQHKLQLLASQQKLQMLTHMVPITVQWCMPQYRARQLLSQRQ
jgi:hypothetical protein